MINVAAIRMKQFGVQFYQASLTAGDIDKLVRFEVLNYGQSGQPPVGNDGRPMAIASAQSSSACAGVSSPASIRRARSSAESIRRRR